MNTKAATYLRVLGNRFHQGPFDMLLKRLPKEEAEASLALNTSSGDISAPFVPDTAKLDSIHYSWFAPLIAVETPERQNLLIGALSQAQGEGVAKLLRKSAPPITLAPPLKKYLQKQLLGIIGKESHLPLTYIPQTQLSELAALNKKQLVEVIDYLGLYDLTSEIRRLVDKRHLKALYEVITPKQHHFLRQCLQQKETIKTPRLHLESWQGGQLELRNLLHPRGIARLGKSLIGQHPDLIWAIVHCLDSGRGRIVERYAMQEEKPGVVFALTNQVLNVVKFLYKSQP